MIEGIYQLAKLHRDAGDEVEIVSLDDPESPWIKASPVPVHALGPATNGYGYSAKFVPWLKNYQCDVIIVNGLWQYSSFGVWRACQQTKIPYFVFPHGMLDPWFKKTYPLKHLKKWLYWPWAEYRVLRDARAVMFTTEEERLAAKKSFWLYQAKERVVGYGTKTPTGNPAQERADFLQAFPQLAGKRLWLFLGRIHPKKGCDLLIEAFARVAKQNPDVQLVMAGPDQTGWQPKLEAMARELGIQDRILWLGMLKDGLKWGAIRNAEVFILPSHQENFGVAVAEALACGIPVLISDKVNIWREIKQENAGLVDSDDLPGTTRLLENWLQTKLEQREAFSRNAVVCFQNHFEMKNVAKHFTREKLLAK